MAGSICAEEYCYVEPADLSGQLGQEVEIPLKAHFDYAVSAFQCDFIFPEGLTLLDIEVGSDINFTYKNERGRDKTTNALFIAEVSNMLFLTAHAEYGYWQVDGEWEPYGVNKWLAGDYEEMAILIVDVAEDFTGGDITVETQPNCGDVDERPDVVGCESNQHNFRTATFQGIGEMPTYDNFFHVNDVEAFHGDTIVIPVAMNNTAEIISFQTDIFMPEGMEIIQEDGEYLIDKSDRMTRTHSIVSNEISSGAIRVLCYSSNYKSFTGNSGDDLFYITVKVADDAEGDYTVYLRNTLFTTNSFEEIDAPDVAGNVHVNAYILGDANNNGTVTVTDVVVTAQYILEMNPQPFVYNAADVNADGNITVTDVSRIAWMVLNPSLNAPRRAPASWSNNDCMSGESISLTAGETRTVSIMLNNELFYSAFQLDLTLPEGLTAGNFALSDRAGSHAFDVSTLSDGKTRALCYSPVLTAISGNEGALLTFDVTATDRVTGGIRVDGIELVTTDCQTVHLDAFAIGVNTMTSVNEMTVGKTIARVNYYNLAGQRIDQPESGVTLVVTTYTDGTRNTKKVFK